MRWQMSEHFTFSAHLSCRDLYLDPNKVLTGLQARKHSWISCTFTSVYMCVHACLTPLDVLQRIYTCIYRYVYICMYVCMYVCMYACMYVCMYMYTYLYIYMYIYPYTYIYIYIYIHIYTANLRAFLVHGQAASKLCWRELGWRGKQGGRATGGGQWQQQ